MKRPRSSAPVARGVVRARTGLLDALASISYIQGMNLEKNDLQAEVLTRELSSIIQNDRYPLSPRIVAPKEILGQLRRERERPEPPPPQRHYEPPSRGRYRRRG